MVITKIMDQVKTTFYIDISNNILYIGIHVYNLVKSFILSLPKYAKYLISYLE